MAVNWFIPYWFGYIDYSDAFLTGLTLDVIFRLCAYHTLLIWLNYSYESILSAMQLNFQIWFHLTLYEVI